jgi:hypothetical protein
MQKHIKAKKIKAAEIHPQSTSVSLLGLAISRFEFNPHQFQGATLSIRCYP